MTRHDIKIIAADCLNRLGVVDWLARRQNAVQILMFHQVNPVENAVGLSVTPELFEKLVIFLKSRYELISLQQAVERLASHDQPTGCVLTFDDGFRDNYDHAFPILKKHGIPATIFATVDALDSGVSGWDLFDQAVMEGEHESVDLTRFGLGKLSAGKHERQSLVAELHRILKALPDAAKREIVDHVIAEHNPNNFCRTMLTWSEAREMADSGLVTIGAHTITHPILSRTGPEQARKEIIDGKTLVEQRLGLPVDYFAYPNGNRTDFNDEHQTMVQAGGYSAACSTIVGSNRAGCNLFALKRFDVTTRVCTDTSGRYSEALFSANISGLFMLGGH
ncbi:MAG: hypothetical protein A2075_18965 [Geobacteraceae bacterium GWC2_58_44]|nr:MAG: hypothetical protein A2075_18965 [Geobacteraceae bacterium GWC2_58_44]HBG07890.1 hypothetical protein [Geobacter sp.]